MSKPNPIEALITEHAWYLKGIDGKIDWYTRWAKKIQKNDPQKAEAYRDMANDLKFQQDLINRIKAEVVRLPMDELLNFETKPEDRA
ncbi:MAG: hypothetical protein IH795_04020 [Bacteroidetes bacterium]|nr:hypothetical protein [Bacteroidota bacterium]